MTKKNTTQKKITVIQIWVGLLLILLTLMMSFMPLITLKTSETRGTISRMTAELGMGDVQVPERVSVTAVGLIQSTKLMIDVARMATDDSPDEEDLKELRERVTGEEGRQTAMIAIAAVATLNQSFSEGDEDIVSDGFMAIVFRILILFAALFAVLGMVVAIPVTLIVQLVIALISALTNLKTPGKAVSRVSGALGGTVTLIFTLMMFQTLLPGMSYGIGLLAMVAIAILSAILNTVVSRVHRYTKEELKYLNVVQGVSVLGVIGFLLFFFHFLKANVFGNFLNGVYTEYLSKISEAEALARIAGEELEVNTAYMIDGILILILFSLVTVAVGYLTACIGRLSCTLRRSDCLLASAIFAALGYVIPSYLMKSKHGYLILDSTKEKGDFTFLTLSGAEQEALTVALVGVILMLVAEIALMILKRTLCRGLSSVDKRCVVSGNVLREMETIVQQEPVAAEEEPVVSEESAKEEATVTEASAEEIPLEEVLTEVAASVEESTEEEKTPSEIQ